MKTPESIKRRNFIKNVALISVSSGISLTSIPIAVKEEENITPTEDLMREHGLLSRILLIYDTCRLHLVNNEEFDLTILSNSAQIVRSFVEDYHEKLEEDFLFPRFKKANKLVDLVNVLREQHDAGRKLTDPILKMDNKLSSDRKKEVIRILSDFNRMYRPHKSREDTVLFPAIREIIPSKEFLDLGEQFEDKEHELFGENGFESVVKKVGDMEKELNIYDLKQFTPK
jgi:hemerythrin-like domain-containing protein